VRSLAHHTVSGTSYRHLPNLESSIVRSRKLAIVRNLGDPGVAQVSLDNGAEIVNLLRARCVNSNRSLVQ